ncbi:hypothetical protein [Enterobacter rongchengensis]|nr:hypothetical protein [Enterobacter sp. 170250]MDY0423705.1 hypothetical protein [Enterobacter sp. 170250]
MSVFASIEVIANHLCMLKEMFGNHIEWRVKPGFKMRILFIIVGVKKTAE